MRLNSLQLFKLSLNQNKHFYTNVEL